MCVCVFCVCACEYAVLTALKTNVISFIWAFRGINIDLLLEKINISLKRFIAKSELETISFLFLVYEKREEKNRKNSFSDEERVDKQAIKHAMED